MELINRISKQITSLHEYVIYVVFTFVMLVKGGYYGYKYNPILDDFIQYNANTLYENPFKDVIIGTGLLNGRPLAGIFDLFFWSNFWDNMWLANLIIVCFTQHPQYLFTDYLQDILTLRLYFCLSMVYFP